MKTCERHQHSYSGKACPKCRNLEKSKKWNAAHPEKVKAMQAARWARDPERERDRSRRWKAKNPEKVKAHNASQRGKRYGLTVAEYDVRVSQPCGICGHKEKMGSKMHVDHDHEKGRVRGTLCHDCNTGLGLFDDSPSRLRAALEYLARYGTV